MILVSMHLKQKYSSKHKKARKVEYLQSDN